MTGSATIPTDSYRRIWTPQEHVFSTPAVQNVRDLWCGHQGPQPPRPLGSAELPQRLGLDLPDPLARDIKLLADLFEGVLALAADAEAQPDDLLLSRREDLQDAGGFVAHVPFVDGVHRRPDRAIFDEVAERRIAFAAHRRFKRQRVAQDGFQLLHLFGWNVHAPAELIVSRRA